jgi:hypothetical protein
MLKRNLPILLVLAVFLTACGGTPATPTMNPADVQNTAVSAAWTMVAATELAKPTATLPPPTEAASPTPLPTFTPEALLIPTLPTFPATPTTAANPGDCNRPLNVAEAGPTVPMRIENATDGGTITVISLYLNKNAFGQCGYLAYSNIKKNGKLTIALPKGNWWATALISYGGNKSGNASGGFTLRPGDEDLLRIVVGGESIRTLP